MEIASMAIRSAASYEYPAKTTTITDQLFNTRFPKSGVNKLETVG